MRFIKCAACGSKAAVTGVTCSACGETLIAVVRFTTEAQGAAARVRDLLLARGFSSEAVEQALDIKPGVTQLTAKGRLLAGLCETLDAEGRAFQCISPRQEVVAPPARPRSWFIPIGLLVVGGVLGAAWLATRSTVAEPEPPSLPVTAQADGADAGVTAQGEPSAPSGLPAQRSRELTPAVIKRAHRAAVKIEAGSRIGAGVIVSDLAVALTNAHVVGDAKTAKVQLWDGRVVDGTVAESRPEVDLAVVTFSPGETEIEVAQFRRGISLDLQDPIFAIGSPGGYRHTVRRGRIAAGLRWVGGLPCLQLDIPIYGGDSGGGVFDHEGRVVGIATMKANGVEGVGFAVLAEMATEGPGILSQYLGYRARSPRLEQFLAHEEGKPKRVSLNSPDRLLAGRVSTDYVFGESRRRCSKLTCKTDYLVELAYEGSGRPPSVVTAHFTGGGGGQRAVQAPAVLTLSVGEWRTAQGRVLSRQIRGQLGRLRGGVRAVRLATVRISGYDVYMALNLNASLARSFVLKGRGLTTKLIKLPRQ